MRKKFEGVFHNFDEDANSTKHKRSGNERPYSALVEIDKAFSKMTSREAGAAIILNLNIEDEVTKLSIDMQSKNSLVLMMMENEIKHIVENNSGRFVDISSAMSKR